MYVLDPDVHLSVAEYRASLMGNLFPLHSPYAFSPTSSSSEQTCIPLPNSQPLLPLTLPVYKRSLILYSVVLHLALELA